MPLPKRYFKPGVYSTLAVLVLAPVFAGLGYWQLQRAEEKQSVLSRRASAELKDPVVLSVEAQPVDLHLKKITVECKLDIDRQLLLDNRVYQQRVGYEVLSACVSEKGFAVLINRGWVKAAATREQLPDIAIKNYSGTVFNGHFAIPGKGFALGLALTESNTDWPRRVQYYDFDAIGTALSLPLLKGVIYLDRASPLVQTYTWKPIAFGPEKHYGYAFQWFALMATLLVLYLVLNIKRIDSQDTS